MSRYRAKLALVACMTLTPLLAAADPVPTNRRADWTHAGVAGGIPNRTNICATFSPGVTPSQINAALLNACANCVVMLNAGVYGMCNEPIRFSVNNAMLGGSGVNQTTLRSGYVFLLDGAKSNGRGIGAATQVANTFTMSSALGPSVGITAEVVRKGDPSFVS